jgi:hypothetical protein
VRTRLAYTGVNTVLQLFPPPERLENAISGCPLEFEPRHRPFSCDPAHQIGPVLGRIAASGEYAGPFDVVAGKVPRPGGQGCGGSVAGRLGGVEGERAGAASRPHIGRAGVGRDRRARGVVRRRKPTSGEGELRIPGRQAIPITRGCVVYSPPDTEYQLVNTGKATLTYFVVVATVSLEGAARAGTHHESARSSSSGERRRMA